MKSRGAQGDLAEIRESLRRVGLRATSARVSVLRVLWAAATPLSHAEVADQIESSGIDRATIYRNLTDLAEHQLARRLEVGGQVWRFEAVDPGHDDDGHPHFTCIVCGKVTCLLGTELEAVARRIAHEVGKLDEVLLRGVCQECDTS